MRTISTALKNAFKTGNRATLMKISAKNGSVYGYTDYDTNLLIDSVVYKAAPGLTRPSMTATSNGEVSNQEFTSAWIDAPEQDLMKGILDNAVIEIAFCDPTTPASGRFIVDKGVLGVIQWTVDGFRGDMQSHMRDLTRQINFVYTASCRHLLFSQFDQTHIGACTLNVASYTYSGTVSSIITPKMKIGYTGIGQPAGWCNNGVLTWVTGSNAGLKHEIKDQVVGQLTLFLPTFVAINVGDTFSITAGCDKTLSACKTKFNNVLNFGGFPHIQTEVQYR